MDQTDRRDRPASPPRPCPGSPGARAPTSPTPTGKRYIDGSGGPAVYCLGHGHEEVNAAIKDQLDRIAHGYRYNFTSDPLEELTELIGRVLRRRAEAHGLRLRRIRGGRILPQDRPAVSRGARRAGALPLHRPRALLARQHAGRARDVGLSGAPRRLRGRARRGPAPVARQRLPSAGGRRRRRTSRLLRRRSWRRRSCELGADKVAAFIFEPVVGAAGGCVPAPPGYAARCARSATAMAC